MYCFPVIKVIIELLLNGLTVNFSLQKSCHCECRYKHLKYFALILGDPTSYEINPIACAGPAGMRAWSAEAYMEGSQRLGNKAGISGHKGTDDEKNPPPGPEAKPKKQTAQAGTGPALRVE
jgi:hypothetical protein